MRSVISGIDFFRNCNPVPPASACARAFARHLKFIGEGQAKARAQARDIVSKEV